MDAFDQFPDAPAAPAGRAADPFDQFPDAAPAAPTAAPSTPVAPEQVDAPAPPPQKPALAGDSLAGVAKAIPQGVVSGLEMLVDAPVNIINQAPRLLNINGGLINKIMGREVVPTFGPISDNPLLPSDIIQAPGRALGVKKYEPQGPVERIADRVGQEVGASALPVVGSVAAGARIGAAGARQMMTGDSVAQRILGPMVEAGAVNPAGVVGRETSGAVAAGLGAGTAVEAVTPISDGAGARSTADFAGSVAGNTALALARPILGGIGSLAGAAAGSTKFADDVARSEVANDLLANSTTAQRQVQAGVDRGTIDAQPLADQLRRPAEVEQIIPGYQADIADRSGDPGLAAYVYGKTAARPGLDTGRRVANQQVVNDRVDGLAPTGNAGQFREDLQGGVDRRLGEVDRQAEEATAGAQRLIEAIMPRMTPQARGSTVRTTVDDVLGRFVAGAREQQAAAARSADEAAARIAPQSDPAVRGDVVRGALESSRAEARQRTADAYGATEIGARQADIAPLTASIDEQIAGMTSVERGLVPQGLIDRVTRLGRAAEDGTPAAPARLKEVTDLRSELDRAQRNAMADPRAENGGRNAARVIGQLQDSVERFITGNLSPDEQAAFQAARGAKFDEAEAFARSGDPVAAALARRPGGQPQMRDERVAGSFVNPATDQPLNRLFAAADTPAVRSAIQDEIAARLPAEARNDPERVDRFLRDYEIPLRQFPGLRQNIAGAAAARRGAAAAEAAVGARTQEFAGGSRALADTTARRADGSPALLDEQIPGRFINPAGNRDIDALFARADTPEVRGALEDEILGRVSGSVDKPVALRQQVDGLREPLSRFPGLRERILSAADAGTARDAARSTADTTRRELTTPGRSPEASYLKYDNTGTVESMRTVLKDPRPEQAVDRLLATSGTDPQNARAAFWEVLRKEATNQGGVNDRAQINGLAGSKFLSDPRNRAVAERLYRDNPEQLKDITDVFDALAGSGAATRARRPGSSGTAQGMNAGYDASLSASSITSRIRSINRGQLSPTVAGVDLLATYLRRKSAGLQKGAIERLQDEVIQNPQLAAKLLEDYNPANFAAQRRELLTVGGVRATETLRLFNAAHDEEQRPEAAAVRRAGER